MAGLITASPSPRFVQLQQDTQDPQCLSSPSPPPADESNPSATIQESQLTAPQPSTQDSSLGSCQSVSQLVEFPQPPTLATSQSASHPDKQPQPSGPSPLNASSSTLPPSSSKHNCLEPKVIDFFYLPKPALLEIPLDEKWVVRLPKKISKIPGGRECAAAGWERNHSHLFRGYGNRADPPGTIPKKWGGFPKEIDDALMRAEEDRALSWERRLRERGLSPTESASSSPRSPPTQEEQDAWFEAYELNIKRNMDALKTNGGELPPQTQRNVITKIARNGITYTASQFLKLKEEETRKALEAAKSKPSENPPMPKPAFGSLRACPTLFFDDVDVNNKGKQAEQLPTPADGLHVVVELSPKRKREPLDDDDTREQKPRSLEEPLAKRTKPVPDTQVEHPSRYSLRNRTPQSQTTGPASNTHGPLISTTKPKSKGKGKALEC